MINFCFDNIINKENNTVYPNLGAEFFGNFEDFAEKFSISYPFSDPPRLLNYLSDENILFNIYTSDACPSDSFYIININFFDRNVDWFARMSKNTLSRTQNSKFKILFYYCEAEAPHIIKKTLYTSAKQHNIDTSIIHFVSHTTIASQIKNFYYFNDDELLFKNAQAQNNSQALWHNSTRTKKFTCLIRSHKPWRFVIGANLNSNGVLKNSYWSYNNIEFSDGFFHTDPSNPLHDEFSFAEITNFENMVPYSSDTLSDNERNNYETFIEQYYKDAYWNIVCETHLNLDNTTGVFITEKTWKPIKHNQPFIIFGTAGSLKHLHELGYKTFDGIIDESYDYIKNDTDRYRKIMEVIINLNTKTISQLSEINNQIKPIVEHNSKLFNSSKRNRLVKLINQLNSNE